MNKNLIQIVYFIAFLLFISSCKYFKSDTSFELDKTIELGSDKHDKVKFNPSTMKVNNLDTGDVVVFYPSVNGDLKYLELNKLAFHHYAKKELKQENKKKRINHNSILEARLCVNYSDNFEINNKISSTEEYFHKDIVKSYLHILLINRSDVLIKDIYVLMSPPPGIEISNINNISSDYKVYKKKDEKGTEYIFVHYYKQLPFSQFIGPPPWVDIKLECIIRFTK